MASSSTDRAILVAATPLGRVAADRGACATAAGLFSAGFQLVDPCPFAEPGPAGPTARAGATARLDACSFDMRMLAARAVVLVTDRLDDEQLEGGLAAEVATRARQSGVPCAAIVAHDRLDRFGARILDLQLVLEARDEAQIAATAATLARIL